MNLGRNSRKVRRDPIGTMNLEKPEYNRKGWDAVYPLSPNTFTRQQKKVEVVYESQHVIILVAQNPAKLILQTDSNFLTIEQYYNQFSKLIHYYFILLFYFSTFYTSVFLEKEESGTLDYFMNG